MEDHLSPLPVAHLLQQTLRSLCLDENSLWIYAVYWRVLPRNHPPPNWNLQEEAHDSSRRNKRNWILAWEDGFCNFAASMAETDSVEALSVHSKYNLQHVNGLQPELFFKMSHEIYNYGEGLIGKVAAENCHKWVYKQHNKDQEINLSVWQQSFCDLHPRTWEAQFQSGVKTIALIAVKEGSLQLGAVNETIALIGVKEGVLQLGAINEVTEDLSYVVQLQRKFNYLQGIPGFLLPHPSSSLQSSIPVKINECTGCSAPNAWPFHATSTSTLTNMDSTCDHFNQPQMITPPMNSFEALLSELPPVMPTPSPTLFGFWESSPQPMFPQWPLGLVEKEVQTNKMDEEKGQI